MRNYDITILDRREIHRLPKSWTEADLKRLALILDLDDTDGYSVTELYDYVLMALQDAGHQAAGESVLEAVFGDDMRAGQRQNLVDDLPHKEPWQDFSSVQQQSGLFNAVVMMYDAYTNLYPNPDAISLTVNIMPTGKTEAVELSAADIMRLLATGMAENDILNRLYDREVEGGEFPQAAGMLWYREQTVDHQYELVSSRQWFGSLARGDQFAATIS